MENFVSCAVKVRSRTYYLDPLKMDLKRRKVYQNVSTWYEDLKLLSLQKSVIPGTSKLDGLFAFEYFFF